MADRPEVLGYPDDDDRDSGPLAPGPNDGSGRQARQGMSGTTKVLLILGGIAGIFMLLCCGVGGYFAYSARNMATDDPVKIRAATAEIADIDVLPGLEPVMSMNMFGIMKFAVYGVKNDKAAEMLMLGSFTNKLGNNVEEQRTAMRQQMEAQSRSGQNLKVLKSESKEFEIRGQKSEFEFIEAEDRDTHTKYRQVTGTFPAKDGIGMLILIIPEAKYDEEAVVKMIKSIH